MKTTEIDFTEDDTRKFAMIGFYAYTAGRNADALKKAREESAAYGQALHDLGAKVAGLQKTLLDAEHERDLLRGFELARTRMADATRPASDMGALIAPHAAPCAVHRRVSVTADGDVWCAECSHLMRRIPEEKREGTGAAPSAAVDSAQRVTAPETPTRAEPAGRSVQSNPTTKEEQSEAATSGASTPEEAATTGQHEPEANAANNDAGASDEGATPAHQSETDTEEQGPGATAEQEPAAGGLRDDQCPACGHTGLSRDKIGGACPAVSGSDGKGGCPDPLAWLHSQEPAAGEQLSDETIPFVPATGGEWKAAGAPYTVGERVVPCVFPARVARGATPALPPDPFLDGAPAPEREEPKHEPWWRYAVGPPKGAYHLFVSAESAEAECGETCDDETRPAPNLPPYEQTCMDCMDLAAQRGIKVPVCADEAPAVAAWPEPPEADDAEEPADEGAAPVRKKYARKPRTCVVPGCGRPGHSATNEFGAKTSGGLWCDEHAKALTAEERRDLHARDKRARKDAAKAARGVAA